MATRWRGRTVSGSAVSIVRAIGGLFAMVIVLYILVILLNANPSNPLVGFLARSSSALALFFPGLFNLGNDTLSLIVNYGLAAVFWVAVTGFVARLLVRLSP
jgi:hypothetical protein